jgi:tetratricopeptide (TPR) repeat protein
VRTGGALAEGSSYGVGRIAAVTALYLGAFLTKESAVTLPGVLFLLDAGREQIGRGELRTYVRHRWRLFSVMAAAAGAVLAMRFAVLGSLANPLGPLGADLLQQGVPRIWTLGGIWTHYVRLMVFPLDLSADYSPNVVPVELGWHALNLAGLVLALAFLAVAWLAFRERELGEGASSGRLVGFGVMWFIITISPISNVFFLAGVLLAERTLYIPSVGAAAVAGWLLARLFDKRRRLGWAVTAIVVIAMGVRTWKRTPTWEHTGTVFETMLRDYPQSGRSQWVLGDLFYKQGRVPESLRSYRAELGILGGHHQLMTEIGKKLIGAKKYRAADFVLLNAWRDEPSWGVAPGYLAINHFQQSDWTNAELYARASLAADGDDPVISHILSSALAEEGRFDEAIQWRENAIRNGEGDNWEQWSTLARLRLTTGDTVGAGAARDSARSRANSGDDTRRVMEDFRPY